MVAPAVFLPISLIFPAGMALAASTDLLTMTIPNRLCATLAVAYFLVAGLLGIPLPSIFFNVSCAALVLGLTFAFFSFGWIGGGDAKFATVTALWLGWGVILDYSLTAAICGGALTFAILLGRRAPLPLWMTETGWIARLHSPKSGVPYGIALAVAGMMIYPQTQVWQSLAIR